MYAANCLASSVFPIPDEPKKRNTRGCFSSIHPFSFLLIAAIIKSITKYVFALSINNFIKKILLDATIDIAPACPTMYCFKRCSNGNLRRSSISCLQYQVKT